MKIFISQPMNGRDFNQIKQEREDLMKKIIEEFVNVEFLDSLLVTTPIRGAKNEPLSCLSASLSILADADLAIFAKGWENARGCQIEHRCCEDYKIAFREEQ
jgi:hypothetical protein